MVDCGAPVAASGVIIDLFNNTKFGALITFHCEEDNNTLITSLCSSNGEWIPNLDSFECGTLYSTTGSYITLKFIMLHFSMTLS